MKQVNKNTTNKRYKIYEKINFMRRVSALSPYLNLLSLILFSSFSQTIISILIWFYDGQLGGFYYNSWYFYEPFFKGIWNEIVTTWIVDLNGIVEYLHNLLKFSLQWESIFQFLNNFDSFRVTILFFKLVLQLFFFAYYRLNN